MKFTPEFSEVVNQEIFLDVERSYVCVIFDNDRNEPQKLVSMRRVDLETVTDDVSSIFRRLLGDSARASTGEAAVVSAAGCESWRGFCPEIELPEDMSLT